MLKVNDEQQDQLKILLKLQNQLEMTNFENEKLNLKLNEQNEKIYKYESQI